MGKHAQLSPSGPNRWIHCPPYPKGNATKNKRNRAAKKKNGALVKPPGSNLNAPVQL